MIANHVADFENIIEAAAVDVLGAIEGRVIAGDEKGLVSRIRAEPEQGEGRIERRADAAGEDLGHKSVTARAGDAEVIQVHVVSGIVDLGIEVEGIGGIGGVVVRVVTDRVMAALGTPT